MSQYLRPNIAQMRGYSSGEQPSDEQTIKLNPNENPSPPSPKVAEALANFSSEKLRIYPAPSAAPLRQAIADHHNLDADQVVVTHAGDEALRLAVTTFVEPDGVVASTEPTYSLYRVLAQIQDAKMHTQDLLADWSLAGDFADQANSAGAQLTCVVNPHAPSGFLNSATKISQLARALDGVLLIDEAYADFVHEEANYNISPLLEKHDNLLILRTFSKGYSLAGLRLGYLLGPKSLIQPIAEKTRDSYNVDAISQSIGKAALEDQTYARATWQRVREQRDALAKALADRGFISPPSATNFLLATVPAPLNAQQLYLQLKDEGILVRYFDTPRLHDQLRITVGTAEQQQRLLAAMDKLITA